MVSIIIFALFVSLMLLGFALVITGIVLLLKMKNKLAGGMAVAIGAIITIAPLIIFLAWNITQPIYG